jgi:phosphoribosyl 1,2-cyclic phosphodiesterase
LPAVQFGLDFNDPPLRFCVLGSGSGGNCVVVESDGYRLLLDAGFSCREIERRLKLVQVSPKSIAAVVLTHEHEDHVRGVARFAGRHEIPVWATHGTLEAAGLRGDTAAPLHTLRPGAAVELPGFEVEAVPIPHDAREPVGLVVRDRAGRRLALLADLGCRSQAAWGRVRDVDAILLETNHDLDMLRNGPYPWVLKQRIASRHGHLSNRDAADGLPEMLHDRLRWVVLYHLSRTNNLPALAHATVSEVLEREGSKAGVALADQDQPSDWMEVSA